MPPGDLTGTSVISGDHNRSYNMSTQGRRGRVCDIMGLVMAPVVAVWDAEGDHNRPGFAFAKVAARRDVAPSPGVIHGHGDKCVQRAG